MTRHEQSGDGAQNGVVAESTATAQGIWQIQISSCTSHCRGVSQVQTAKQRNRTVQTLGRSRHLTGTERKLRKDDRGKTNTGPAATTKTRLTESGKPDLTQIQLGCISHCFGTTTSTRQLPPGAHPPTMQELFDTIARAMPSLQDVPAAEQNTVVQTSHQWQYGNALGRGQTQTASQLSSTAQSHDVLLTGAARAGLGDHVPELVNQTEQGIWQLQIGCLAFCSETRQVQHSEQSNTTLRSTGTERDSSSYPPTSSVNVTTQTVWQVQVGCMMWCFETEQQQTASSENAEGELPGEEAAEGTPPPAGVPPTAGTQPPAGVPPTAGAPPPAGVPTPTNSAPRNPCDHSPTPRECHAVVRLGAWRQATNGTGRPSSRPASRTRRAGQILAVRSGTIAEASGGDTPNARPLGAGAGASVAIYQLGAAQTNMTPRRAVMGPRLAGGGHRQDSPVSRSLAAGMSAEAGSGSDTPVIALVAAIALCALAAARAFRSEPMRRRRATEK
jgi:hypothetical protein